MTFVLLLLLLLFLSVALMVMFGPPYLPTMQRQTEAALDLLDLKPGQTLLELGAGDGRVMRAAARRGLNVVGIELSPLMFLVAHFVTWRYRRQVTIVLGNYFYTEWPQAEGIFTFMIQRQMGRLDRRVEGYRKGRKVRLVSVAFRIPDKKPAAKRDGVFRYDYK